MEIIKTVDELLKWREGQSKTLGFIPTLGALHEGHFSLIKKSKQYCRLTVVSIFLNPSQFAPDEDLDKYPNTLEQDIIGLNNLQVDVLFLPSQLEMNNNVDDVNVPDTLLFNKLEGKSRPHFFYGVTNIVAKLFNIIQPPHTFFGEKDAQQLYIIKQMINNMQYAIVLIPCPTIREKTGLALSSRNQYLNSDEQEQAAIIYHSLMHIKKNLEAGETNPIILKNIYKTMINTVPGVSVDYISIAEIDNLNEINKITDITILISTAVFFKGVRLIDNFTYSFST